MGTVRESEPVSHYPPAFRIGRSRAETGLGLIGSGAAVLFFRCECPPMPVLKWVPLSAGPKAISGAHSAERCINPEKEREIQNANVHGSLVERRLFFCLRT